MFYVYRHRDLVKFNTFYIGISNNLNRPKSTKSRNRFWSNLINKYGFYSEVIHICDTWKEACELECLLISEYGRRDLNTGCLVNMTDGGDGLVGQLVTKSTRTKISKSLKGKKFSSEHKNNIRKSKLGCKLTKQSVFNRSETNSKPIVKLPSGEIFKSAKVAAETLGLDSSSITKVCKGKRKTAGGFIWKYKDK